MNNSGTGVGETHDNLAIRQTIVAGAAAGSLVVPGWTPGSSLKSVVTLAGVDRTAEFFENVAGTGIDNTGGATTAGSTLLVLFIAAHPKGGRLTRK